MSVPDTETFTLQDVATELGGGEDSLQVCFDNASSVGFDVTYDSAEYTPADSLLRFRNYSHGSSTQRITLTYIGSALKIETARTPGDQPVDIDWGDGNSETLPIGVQVTGSLTHNYASPGTYNVIIESTENIVQFFVEDQNITNMNLSKNTTGSVNIANNNLVSLIIGDSPYILSADGNNLSTASVDNILKMLDDFGILSSFCILNNQTPPAPPSAAGLISKANLEAKGWGVLVD